MAEKIMENTGYTEKEQKQMQKEIDAYAKEKDARKAKTQKIVEEKLGVTTDELKELLF